MKHTIALSLTAAILGAGILRAQTASPAAHPHVTRASPVADPSSVTKHIPFETPASLACIYRLVPTIVPGCPVILTSATPQGGGNGGLIVVVNAFDYPAAQNDLNVFSTHFAIPGCAGGSCVTTVYASGTPPPVNALWAENAANIIEYAHAFAPLAQIILVEAASATIADLDLAVEFANNYILQNSPTGGGQMVLPFGSDETPGETIFDQHLTTPGVVYISGNEGNLNFFDYPGTSPNVISLGGTRVLRDGDGNFVAESASTFWNGGSSLFEAKPPYQEGIAGIVGNQRAIPDLAFASDPINGASLFYDSIKLDGFVGWQFMGDVAVGEAAVAAIINAAGSNAPSSAAELTQFYSELANAKMFRDVALGEAFDFKAATGWDVLTGIGVPISFLGK